MSVTVLDLLKLPSLNKSKVLGGRNGLTKIVSSISVLESIDPKVLVDTIFPQGEFYGSELVVTGFLNCADNVDLQCENMRRLAEGGEVGIILYYVGAFLPKVDERLIRLADELDFVLICMPEGNTELRYGEVINDVMECIFRDRAKNDSIVLDILDRVSGLPKHQQSVNTVLKMISDRVSASIVLCDEELRILNMTVWPRGNEENVKRYIEKAEFTKESESGSRLYRTSLKTDSGQHMELFILKSGPVLDPKIFEQIIDAVRIGINIWGRKHGEVAIHELVRSILQDEPMKMNRLARIFHIDIGSIHEMWILKSEQAIKELSAMLEDYFSTFKGTAITDIYEGHLMLFMSTPESQYEAETMMEELYHLGSEIDQRVTLTRCSLLENTSEVRKAYFCYKNHLKDAGIIFPDRHCFSIADMEFTEKCKEAIQTGEDRLKKLLMPLKRLNVSNDGAQLEKTLEVFLLEGDMSATKTAQILFLHVNTVKYRLRRISDLLGYRPGKMPEVIGLYQAAAIQRLIR
ncbi:MAG: PucR family transcriptional regulator ligand-binding domain-containing protein [Lachnospiraceae bacterium]|nr:PucR family transcriptional regulator ligand-binding domain-containing protein [Lachnospiraceae bacterium]